MRKTLGALLTVPLLLCSGGFVFAYAQGDPCTTLNGASGTMQWDANLNLVCKATGQTTPPGSVQTGGGQTPPGSVQLTGPAVGTGGTSMQVNTPLVNPIKANTFGELVEKVISTAVQVLMPIVVLMFIYSGFLFVTAQGNEKKLEEAKKAITWSVVGAFILLGAQGFAQMIGTTVTNVTGIR